MVFLGVTTVVAIFLGKYVPNPLPQKMAEIGNFKPKRRKKTKIAISPKL